MHTMSGASQLLAGVLFRRFHETRPTATSCFPLTFKHQAPDCKPSHHWTLTVGRWLMDLEGAHGDARDCMACVIFMGCMGA